MKKCMLTLALLTASFSFAQNETKRTMVIVPKRFEFQKKENQHRINSLVAHLLEKNGYQPLWEDKLHEMNIENPCENLRIKVLNKSSILTTKVNFELIDCKNQVVFTSEEGKSREKDFTKSYGEALRNAFGSLKKFSYKNSYQNQEKSALPIAISSENTPKITNSTKNDTQKELLTAHNAGEYILLLDNQKNTIFTLQKTPIPHTYIANRNDKKVGLLRLESENSYIFEYQEDNSTQKVTYFVDFNTK